MNPDEKSEHDLDSEPGPGEGTEEPAGAAPEQALEFEEIAPADLPEEEETQADGPDEEGDTPEPERRGKAARPPADGSKLRPIIEALIFVSEQPISLDKIAGVLTDCPRQRLREILSELEQEYREREGALEIIEVANGYQFRTRAEFAPWLGRLRQQKFARLSRAALETLAIVAYRQPVTRAEAEAIRGVDSGAVLGTLLERRLLRVVGRKEVAGRPILYGTTQDFLELFGLKSLKDLPTLREIKDMVDTAQEGPESQAQAGDEAEGVGEQETEEKAGAADLQEATTLAAGTDAEGSGESDEEEDEYEDDEEDQEGDGEEAEWSEDEEPLGDEEMTAHELDEILKSTRTRLEIYEEVVQDQEESGEAEPAEEGEGAGATGGDAADDASAGAEEGEDLEEEEFEGEDPEGEEFEDDDLEEEDLDEEDPDER